MSSLLCERLAMRSAAHPLPAVRYPKAWLSKGANKGSHDTLQKATVLRIVGLQASNVDDHWQRSTIEHRWQKKHHTRMHLVKTEGQTHSAPKGQPRGRRNHHCEQTLLLEGGVPGPIHHHPQNQQPSGLDLRLPHQQGGGGSSSLSLSPSALGGAGIRAGSLCATARAGRRRLYRSGVLHARNMSFACATVVSISPGGRCGTCLPSSVTTSASTLTG